MTLWELLLLIDIGGSVGGGFAAANAAQAGAGGRVTAVTVGFIVGITFAWSMHRTGRWIGARIQRTPVSRHEIGFRRLYFVAFVWPLVASTVAMRIALFVLRLTRGDGA